MIDSPQQSRPTMSLVLALSAGAVLMVACAAAGASTAGGGAAASVGTPPSSAASNQPGDIGETGAQGGPPKKTGSPGAAPVAPPTPQAAGGSSSGNQLATSTINSAPDLIDTWLAKKAEQYKGDDTKHIREKINKARLGGAAVKTLCDFRGTIEYSADTRIDCPKVRFAPDTRIRVRNGALLYFTASTLIVEGSLTIDGQGEPGEAGPRGTDAGPDWSSGTEADYWAARNACANDVNSPERGTAGGPGKQGGPGAVIILRARPTGPADLNINPSGGRGGEGGGPGRGRTLRNGRNNYCDGCIYECPNRGPGRRGDDGPSGAVLIYPD